MEIEIFTLCDFAENMGGKLCIVGTFDCLNGNNFRLIHPTCSIALRGRFSKSEEGRHSIDVAFVDMDGKSILPDLKSQLEVKVPADADYTVSMIVMGIGQLRINKPGKYCIDLIIDGKRERSLPLFVRKIGQALKDPLPV